MAGSAFDADEDFISGINITPLVDVALVLLIIFMITAPALYQSAIKVQLPKAKTGEETQKSPLTFTLSREGELSWDRENHPEKLDWSALGSRLTALGPQLSEQTAVISADDKTPHGTVIRLMDALRQAGLTRFALNVEGGTPPAPTPAH